MNERIKELADRIWSLDIEPDERFKESLQNFAELIIQECISIAQDRSAFYWEPPNNVNHTINKIRQHFGVEE